MFFKEKMAENLVCCDIDPNYQAPQSLNFLNSINVRENVDENVISELETLEDEWWNSPSDYDSDENNAASFQNHCLRISTNDGNPFENYDERLDLSTRYNLFFQDQLELELHGLDAVADVLVTAAALSLEDPDFIEFYEDFVDNNDLADVEVLDFTDSSLNKMPEKVEVVDKYLSFFL